MMQLQALISLQDQFSAPMKKQTAALRMFESSTTSAMSTVGAMTRSFSGASTASSSVSRAFKTLSAATNTVAEDLRTVDVTQPLDGADVRYDSLGRRIRTVFKGVSAEAQRMSAEIRSAFAQQRVAMNGLRDDSIKSQYAYFQLAKSSKEYTGTTGDFINQIEKMGKADKKTKDAMIASNEVAKMSFYQSVGSMMARSTQSSKIADNFARMNNPIYKLNTPLLSVANGLEGIAKRGTPAALALRALGPTANMKQLNDMTRMISQGLMRSTAVALVAGVAAYAFYSKLHKSAMDANKGYADSFKAMTASISQTFDPLVQTFAELMTPIYNVTTKISDMIAKFQEAHPTIAKVASVFMILVPALTLILSPLAVGIGLFGGLGAAIGAMAPLLAPVVVGFASIMGTVVAVAAGITLLGTAFYLLYAKSETFRSGVTAIWNGIKSAAMSVFNFLAPYVNQAMTAVTTFVQSKLTMMQQFWTQNGAQILTALTNVWTVITSVVRAGMAILTPIFMIGFALVKTIVVGAWAAIKNVITGALNVIMGVVKVFTGIFTGDFSKMWEGVKQIFFGAIQAVWGYVNLVFVGRILKAGAALFTGLRSTVSAGWSSIRTYFSNSISSIKSSVSGAWTTIKGLFTGGFNNAKATVSGGWNSIKSFFSNGISNAKTSVSNGFQNMLTTVTSKIDSIKSKIADWAKSLPGNMLSAFSSAVGQLSSIGSLVWEQIKGSLPNISSIKDYVTGAVTGKKSGKKGGGKSDGSFYSGAYNIPHNGFQATLHSGESVLTASQSNTLRKAGVLSSRNGNRPVVNPSAGASTASVGGTVDRSINITMQGVAIREEADIAKVAAELASLLEGFDDRAR
ncbi:hypothetical protein [Exiguobacterium sp. LL15]|uniref:phage tail protein n=1 Tax=Exiguobacterium sp. LL15 TaxID=2950547 RepID=UPI00210DE50F|nr:hypothetical protein [Exiguobacterium sp. LL15]MCQ4089458.1 hypothetical protein [Exiguobacterium sp. LL15]